MLTAGASVAYVCNGGVPANVPPVGSVLAFGGDTPPSGWLPCDGSPVGRGQYPALFAAIGVHWGAGDSITTFNLPDLRGRFLRGQDHGSGHDPDVATRVASGTAGSAGDSVGSFEADAVKPHTHPVNDPGHMHSADHGVFVLGSTAGGGAGLGTSGPIMPANPQYSLDTATGTTGVTVSSNTGIESRPANVAVNYIIRY